jgi:hypothetical protein
MGDRAQIMSSEGRRQGVDSEQIESSMGGGQSNASPINYRALTFNDNTPLQFSDGSYLELAA